MSSPRLDYVSIEWNVWSLVISQRSYARFINLSRWLVSLNLISVTHPYKS
uniref:Uncharacterized protein n=1 Tax=Picea glauca TaxID=3330 RepID=A0A101LYZ7_PICGL|nr:hypothetical protein ABT39_MTgene4932 [Picea glauca]